MKSIRRKAALVLACFVSSVLPAAAFWNDAAQATAEERLLTVSTGAAPTAASIEAETVAGVMIEIPLSATDPDGDAVIFKLIDTPRIGTAVIEDDKVLYTPANRKTGTDKFTYCAIDTMGNESEPAQIKVKIRKNSAKVTYADMTDNPSHLAAVKLAEAGVFLGEKIGASYFLHPNEEVTRSEFIAMAAAAADLELTETACTDFQDDQALSPWVKPYVSAAANAGWINGYATASGVAEIRGEKPITLAEASVIVSKLLGSDAVISTSTTGYALVPAWAEGAAAALTAAKVMPESERDHDGGSTITRQTACELLYRAMQVQNEENG